MNAPRTGFRLSTSIVAVIAFASAPAMADVTKDQCIEANGKGQELRREGKLTGAREQLRTCSAASCPAMVRDDCTKRLDELETAQPTIIFEAKDASGRDTGAVSVTVDGTPLAEKLDGTAMRVDPGEHVFTFTGANHPSVTQTFIIREGQKERRELLVIGSLVASPAPTPQTATFVPTTAPPQAALSADTPRRSSQWKTVGWVLGGAGMVGLGVGTVFGVMAIGDKSAAHCNANKQCDPGTVSGIKSAALVSDVGWIAGGVLLASGVALVLFAPRGSHEPAAGIRLAPVLTARGGEVVAGGSW